MSEEPSPALPDERYRSVPRHVVPRFLPLVLNFSLSLCWLSLAVWIAWVMGSDYLKTGTMHERQPWGLIAIGLMVFCFSIILLNATICQYRREERLLTRGTAVGAEIVRQFKSRAKNGRYYYSIRYHFRPTQNDRLYEGLRTDLPATTPQIHLDEPVVFYDPTAPQINALYPMKMVRLPD